MLSTPTADASVYTDIQGLNALKVQARKDTPQALKAVTQQFEAMFMQMLLKSAEEASLGDPLFGSDQMKFYRSMHNQQLGLTLAQSGGVGIAEMMEQELARSMNPDDVAPGIALRDEIDPSRRLPYEAVLPKIREMAESSADGEDDKNELLQGAEIDQSACACDPKQQFASPEDFVQSLWPHAQQAAEQLGVSPEVLVAQAALETGWGKFISRDKEGNSGFNLFNIKADGRWGGRKLSVATTEFMHNQYVQMTDNFRAYESYEDSFNDYVKFLRENPRYADVINGAQGDIAFAEGLQKAGYATDPNYAKKINRVLNSGAMATALNGLKISQLGTL